ncbi:hypothetical protein J6590_060859 [Homalodisca vitripennis]|nr:hypothetical protein J6590_060859 [Homalodisca vitripennis]
MVKGEGEEVASWRDPMRKDNGHYISDVPHWEKNDLVLFLPLLVRVGWEDRRKQSIKTDLDNKTAENNKTETSTD